MEIRKNGFHGPGDCTVKYTHSSAQALRAELGEHSMKILSAREQTSAVGFCDARTLKSRSRRRD